MHALWTAAKLKRRLIKHAYRSIATCYPSQDLFDDLVNKDQISTLQDIENRTSEINQNMPQKNRVFQYFDSSSTLYVFCQPSFWGGRFSDGSFGVWYGALEEETSIQEALHWSSTFVAPDLNNTRNPITIDRRMFQVSLDHECTADFRESADLYPLLTHPKDYSLCRELGHEAIEQKIGFLLTPSARRQGGTCSPTFAPEVITEEKTIYYLRFTFAIGQDPVWTKSPSVLM